MRSFLLPLFLLVSCSIVSIEPYCDRPERDSVQVRGLQGLWLARQDETDDPEGSSWIYFRFERHRKAPGYRLTVSQKDALEVSFEAHAFEVGDRLFLDTSLQDFQDPPGAEAWELPSLALSHILPVHVAWHLERRGVGFRLAMVSKNEVRHVLRSPAPPSPWTTVPETDSLVLTGSSAQSRALLAASPEKGMKWLELRRARQVVFPD